MTTEITEIENARGWILFDAQCFLCTRLARRCGPLLRRHGFALLPLQTPWVRERLAKCGGDLLSEMRLLTPHGIIYGGADGLISLAAQIWWARPLYWLARAPIVRTALRKAYAWIARHRSCIGGRCHHGAPSRRYKTRVFFEMP